MWKKISVFGGAALLVLGLITSGFVVEDRYNNQDHHDKDITVERSITEMKLDKVETELVMNLKQFQKEQQVSLKSQKRENDYRYYMGVLENIQAQIYKLRQWLRQHPGDQEAREDYNSLRQKETNVKQRLTELMK